MKKIISILFLFCFVVCTPSRAQWQALAKVSHTPGRALSRGVPVKPPRVMQKPPRGMLAASQHARVGGLPTSLMRYGVNPVTPILRGGTGASILPNIMEPTQNPRKLFPTAIPDIYLPSNGLMKGRGFIPDIHIPSPTSSEPNLNAPKLNLDKIRMKVMMKQNRLNKNEMKADEFIIIGLLIYHNEYGGCHITDYAA